MMPLVPDSKENNIASPNKYLVPFSNGFITFKAVPTMEVFRDFETPINDLPMPASRHNEARFTFNFIPDDDEEQTLFKVYSGYTL